MAVLILRTKGCAAWGNLVRLKRKKGCPRCLTSQNKATPSAICEALGEMCRARCSRCGFGRLARAIPDDEPGARRAPQIPACTGESWR